MIERQFIEVAGLQTGFSVQGSGPRVLLLHGGRLGYSLDIWSEISSLLATNGFQAIALDMPGYGFTDAPTNPSATFTLQFIIEFIEKRCANDVHIVGHSNSGGPMVQVGLDRPEIPRSLVIAGTGSLMPVTIGIAASLKKQLPLEDDLLTEPTIEETRLDFLPDVYDPKVLTPERLELLNSMSRGNNFIAARDRQRANRTNRDQDRKGVPLWQRLDELKVPVMAIFGVGDKNRAADRLPMLAARYPEIETHLLDHCKHVLQWDATSEFGDLLIGFFHKVDANSTSFSAN